VKIMTALQDFGGADATLGGNTTFRGKSSLRQKPIDTSAGLVSIDNASQKTAGQEQMRADSGAEGNRGKEASGPEHAPGAAPNDHSPSLRPAKAPALGGSIFSRGNKCASENPGRPVFTS
jgi:hypothetical protein